MYRIESETSGFTSYSTPPGKTHRARFIRMTSERPHKAKPDVCILYPYKQLRTNKWSDNPIMCNIRNPIPGFDKYWDLLKLMYYLNTAIHFVFFTLMWPCIVTNFFVIKPTRCTNFTNLFCHETLHDSDSSSAHHQEFIHCTLSNGICHTAFEQDHGPARKLSTNLYDIYHCWVYSE